MNHDKGKRLAAVVSDASLPNALTAEPTLDRNTQGRIGDQLRAMYDDLVHQPVPDRFKDLLERLEKGTAGENAQ
jgi:hypothetical protein